MALLLFAAVFALLLAGYPVAFTLAGTALAFAAGGILLGAFDPAFLSALPGRLFGTISNATLIRHKHTDNTELPEDHTYQYSTVRG